MNPAKKYVGWKPSEDEDPFIIYGPDLMCNFEIDGESCSVQGDVSDPTLIQGRVGCSGRGNANGAYRGMFAYGTKNANGSALCTATVETNSFKMDIKFTDCKPLDPKDAKGDQAKILMKLQHPVRKAGDPEPTSE
jgi:hypothetical protein